jgi:hypothetical protein
MNFLLILTFRAATCFAVVPPDDVYPNWVDKTLEETGLDAQLTIANWYGTELAAGTHVVTGFATVDVHGIVYTCDSSPMRQN